MIFTDTWHPNTVTQPGTLPGLDAYQGALVPNNATPSQLLTAWNYALNVTDQLPFPISSATIDEVAILAQDGAYPRPWSWSLDPKYFPFNQNIQANWYSMVCTFFREHSMGGVYFWGIWYADGANALPQTPSPGLAQKIQPASAAVIKSCFTRDVAAAAPRVDRPRTPCAGSAHRSRRCDDHERGRAGCREALRQCSPAGGPDYDTSRYALFPMSQKPSASEPKMMT